jgi:hypothetical protein
MGGALDGMTRTLDRVLGRCAGLVPPGRQGWAEAVRAEASEVPAGAARLGWLGGGLWLVMREAGMIRRIGYGLGMLAVAVTAAMAVRYLWSAAHVGRDGGWDKARMLLLVALLAGLPWVARRRGVFGPVGRSVAARAVRAVGGAALVVLVLDFARVEHFPSPVGPGPWPSAGPWNLVHEGAALVLIGACLAAVLIVPVRWPRVRPVAVAWCAAAAALVLFFTVVPLQVLIVVYIAGILAVTSTRSPVAPATLATSAGTGAVGGLLIVALWDPLQAHGPSYSQGDRAILLFILLAVVAATGTALAGKAAARRARGADNPVALRAQAWQYLAAGPLTAATAALTLPLLRVSAVVHIEAMCPAFKALHPGMRPFLCTSAPAIWTFYLVAGPIIGLAIGTCMGAAITAPKPPTQPPRKPPPEPPSEPEPDGSRWGGVFVKI